MKDEVHSLRIEDKEVIRKMALDAGFHDARFTDCLIEDHTIEHLTAYENRIQKQDANNGLSWFLKYKDIRRNPHMLLENVQSVLILASVYHTKEAEPYLHGRYCLARYALGKDYHLILKKKGNELLKKINDAYSCKGRVLVDTAPFLEKYFAVKSGIGFYGKNSLVISPSFGSFFHITVILLNLSILPDHPAFADCGSCTNCIAACPAGAIQHYSIDPYLCTSYRTIESKEIFCEKQNTGGYIFGCDLCQNVCPYNRPPAYANFEEYKPSSEIPTNITGPIDRELFERIKKESVIQRVSYEKFNNSINTT